MKPCVMLINGFPGVGKHTIASLIHEALGAQSRYLHNHLLIDPVEAIHPGRTPAHYALRQKFRRVAFDALIADPSADRIVVLTACLGDNENDVEAMRDHLRVARERRVHLYWVNLLCDDAAEHSSRIASEQRKSGGTTKCTDPRVLEELERSGVALLTMWDVSDDTEDLPMKFCMLDSSTRSPEECARILLRWIAP